MWISMWRMPSPEEQPASRTVGATASMAITNARTQGDWAVEKKAMGRKLRKRQIACPKSPLMVRFAASMPVLLAVSLLSGCFGGSADGEPSSTTSSTSEPDLCQTVEEGTAVAGWVAHGGLWGPVAAMEGHNEVVCGKATAPVQSLVRSGGTYSDFEANVSFNMLAGDSGAGLVIHFANDENFNIIRYSPREQGWHLFTMVNGNRDKQQNASVTPPTTNPELHQWVALRIVSKEGHVTAFDGPTKVIDYELPDAASHQGSVGYFLRDEGMVALFDDFSVVAPA